jgi:hypothetical protein
MQTEERHFLRGFLMMLTISILLGVLLVLAAGPIVLGFWH